MDFAVIEDHHGYPLDIVLRHQILIKRRVNHLSLNIGIEDGDALAGRHHDRTVMAGQGNADFDVGLFIQLVNLLPQSRDISWPGPARL